MGKFDFEIDPAFLRSLGKLAEVEKYAPQMIDAATGKKHQGGTCRTPPYRNDGQKRQAHKGEKGEKRILSRDRQTDRNVEKIY